MPLSPLLPGKLLGEHDLALVPAARSHRGATPRQEVQVLRCGACVLARTLLIHAITAPPLQSCPVPIGGTHRDVAIAGSPLTNSRPLPAIRLFRRAS